MRLLMINLLAAALVLFSASFASAYELRLIETSGAGSYLPGEQISYDVYLDTQGASDIVLFSISLEFDQSIIAYDPGNSEAEDYYPLYAPSTGKANPPTYLAPVFNPWNTWNGNPPPSGNSAIMVDFIESNLNPTTATATNQYLGTIAFTALVPGVSPNLFAFQNADQGDGDFGNIFNVLGVDVSPSVSVVGGGPITVVPEPTTALLIGLGLVGLGAAGRRRA